MASPELIIRGENRGALHAIRSTQAAERDLASSTARTSASMSRSHSQMATASERSSGRIQKASATASSSIARLASRAALGLGVIGAAGAGLAVAMGLHFYNIQQAGEIAFTTMLGSGQKARVFLDKLAKFAAVTPFEFPGLVQGAQRMLGMGIAAKDVIPTLQAAAAAVASVGGGAEQIDSATRALGQIQAKGRLQAEEMLQLNESIGFSWAALADELGVTAAKAMDLSQRGEIDAATFLDAFRGHYKEFGSKLLEANSKTLAGVWSTFKDTFSAISAQLLTPVFDALASGIGQVNEQLGEIAKARTIRAKLAIVWQGIEGVGESLWTKIREAFEGSIESERIQVSPDKFIEVSKEREGIGQRIAEAISNVDWGEVGGKVATGLLDGLEKALTAGGGILTKLDPIIGGIDEWINDHLDDLAEAGALIIVGIFAKLTDPSFWVRHWRLALTVALTAFGGSIARAAGAIARVFLRPFGRAVAELGPFLAHGLSRLGGVIGGGIARLAPALGAAIERTFRRAARWVAEDFPGWLVSNIENLPDLFERAFRRIPRVLRVALIAPFVVVGDRIRDIGDRISGFFGGTFTNALRTAFQFVVHEVLDWTVQRFLRFAELILAGADKAFGWVPGLGGKIDSARGAIARMRAGVDAFGQSADKTKDKARGVFDVLGDIRGLVGNISSRKLIFHIQGLAGLQSARAYLTDLNAKIGDGEFELPGPLGAGKADKQVDSRLWPALGLASSIGLSTVSTYRPGATVRGSGGKSDHSYFPSKAIDEAGSPGLMDRFARLVAGLPGIDTVIYSPIGLWKAGVGWGGIRSAVTKADHYSHVHVDTFQRGGIAEPRVVPGFDSGRDEVPALLRRGEMVLTPLQQAWLGGRDYLASKFGMGDRLAGPFGFALGGIFGRSGPDSAGGGGGGGGGVSESTTTFAGLSTTIQALLKKSFSALAKLEHRVQREIRRLEKGDEDKRQEKALARLRKTLGRIHSVVDKKLSRIGEIVDKAVQAIASRRDRAEQMLERQGVDTGSAAGMSRIQQIAQEAQAALVKRQTQLQRAIARARKAGASKDVIRQMQEQMAALGDEIFQGATDIAVRAREIAAAAAREAVEAAETGVGLASTRLRNLELQQELAGTAGTAAAAAERAAFIRSQIVPAIDAQIAALSAQQAAAAAAGDTALANQLAVAIEQAQGDKLQALIDASEETADNTAETTQALKEFGGAIGFDFGGSIWTNAILGSAVGA